MNKLILTILLTISSLAAYTQNFSFTDLSIKREKADRAGNTALSILAVANLGGGIVGYATSYPEEFGNQYSIFTAGYGVVEGIIALSRSSNIKSRNNSDFDLSYEEFEGSLKSRQVNTIFDFGLIAVGAVLYAMPVNILNNPQMVSALGLATCTQGVLLYIMDRIVYTAHNKNSYKWLKLLQSINASPGGVSINYRF